MPKRPSSSRELTIPTETIERNIYFIRGHKVMVDRDLATLYGVPTKRLNEQVTIAIRGMQSADFTDPGLGLIKRIILEKTNRALGKPLVREAIISQFSFVER